MSKDELIDRAIKAPRGSVIVWFKNNQVIYSLYKHRGGKRSRVSVQKDGEDFITMKYGWTIKRFISYLYSYNLFLEFLDAPEEN